MQKVILTFPDPNSLWLFKDKSKAINVTVAPRRNMITGLFSSEDVETAVKQFRAVQMDYVSNSTNTSVKHIETRISKSLFGFRFSQLLSLLNL